MKIVVTFIIMMMPFMACNVYSQECEKNIDSEKLLEERIDSLKSFEAEKAITDKHFVLEADKVVVFQRVCLRQVCLRSDDAKLIDNFVFHIKKANFVL